MTKNTKPETMPDEFDALAEEWHGEAPLLRKLSAALEGKEAAASMARMRLKFKTKKDEKPSNADVLKEVVKGLAAPRLDTNRGAFARRLFGDAHLASAALCLMKANKYLPAGKSKWGTM